MAVTDDELAEARKRNALRHAGAKAAQLDPPIVAVTPRKESMEPATKRVHAKKMCDPTPPPPSPTYRTCPKPPTLADMFRMAHAELEAAKQPELTTPKPELTPRRSLPRPRLTELDDGDDADADAPYYERSAVKKYGR